MKRDRTMPQMVDDVPDSIKELAWQRVGHFLKHMWICKFDLRAVVISAYLQGVNDALDAQAAKR